MQRRSLLKATLGLAAACVPVAVSRGAGQSVEAETPARLVGTGCSSCRPDLFPAGRGDDRLPMDANHYSARWMRIPDPYVPPVIMLAGVPVSQVTELHTGPDGWLIRNHLDDAHLNPNGKPSRHHCDCGAPEVQMELWRGNVTQENIVPMTIPEIMAARDERVQRDAQFREIDLFLSFYPDWAETVHAERRDHPGQRPVLRRDALVDMAATHAANDGYLRKTPGDPYLAWERVMADNSYKELWENRLYPMICVTRNPDGSYDVRRTIETQQGDVIRVKSEDHYATAADLPASIPAEMR